MFERQTMEQIVNKMIKWSRGTTTKLTDFRVGSKTRTIYEAVGVIVEELYDRVYRSIKNVIEENIYAVIGFDKIPATYSTGTARFSKDTASTANLTIPAGTEILSKATEYSAPIKYRTTKKAVLEVGKTFVDIPIVCTVPGVRGNVSAGSIIDFVQKPSGIDSVTNPSATTGGKPEESKEEQKARFQLFIEANTRGIIPAVKYGASIAYLTDANGNITERVQQAVAIEDLVNKVGQVDVYVWNGVGSASTALIDEVKKILTGFHDENGDPVYGYKPAGIIPNVYTATAKSVTLKLTITYESWTNAEEVNPKIEDVIDAYFAGIKLGETFIQTELEAEVKFIEGVKDVKLGVSLDGGTTYTTDNVTALASEIIVANKPINYV